MPEQNIFVTYEAANENFRQITDEKRLHGIKHKFGINFRYILAIGSADPRKNLHTLVQAYAQLPADIRALHKLVIVWNDQHLAADLSVQVDHSNLSHDVKFVDQVSNEDLLMLYNAASVFVFLSLYEGFGLPPLEAMACGTPVIAANNSSIPEIVGDAALLIEAKDVQAIASAIAKILTDESHRANLITNGLRRAAKFSWEKCACETIRVYKQILHLKQ